MWYVSKRKQEDRKTRLKKWNNTSSNKYVKSKNGSFYNKEYDRLNRWRIKRIKY